MTRRHRGKLPPVTDSTKKTVAGHRQRQDRFGERLQGRCVAIARQLDPAGIDLLQRGVAIAAQASGHSSGSLGPATSRCPAGAGSREGKPAGGKATSSPRLSRVLRRRHTKRAQAFIPAARLA